MSATEDRTYADVADRLAEWNAVQEGTASRTYPPLNGRATTEVFLAKMAVEDELGVKIERGSRAYDALLVLARKAFNEGHDLTRNIERGVRAGQAYEVDAAMHHAEGRATQAHDSITTLIRTATAIKFTEPREFARMMKELRHLIWQYASATARRAHMYHCLYHPGDPLQWNDYEQQREEEERARQRREAEKRIRGSRRR